jgi:hypothetical protein
MCSQQRQPPLLLVDLQGIAKSTGQPHCQLLAEAEGPVVDPAELDRFYRQVCPLRELAIDQPPG